MENMLMSRLIKLKLATPFAFVPDKKSPLTVSLQKAQQPLMNQ